MWIRSKNLRAATSERGADPPPQLLEGCWFWEPSLTPKTHLGASRVIPHWWKWVALEPSQE